MIIKEKINLIAVIGETQDAVSIVLHLANTDVKISYFDIPNQRPKAFTVNEMLEENPRLLLSKKYLNRIKQYDHTNFLALASTFDWIILVLNDNTSMHIRELLKNVEGILREETLISVTSENQSIKLPISFIPISMKAAFAGIRFFKPYRKCDLVEVVSLPETSLCTLNRIRDFCEIKMGKSAIFCNKSGFADRLVCFIQIWALRTGLNLGLDLEQINMLTGRTIGWPGKGVVSHIDLEGPNSFYAKSKILFRESPIPEEKDSYIFLSLMVMPPSGYFNEPNLVFDPLKGRYRKLRKRKIKGLLKFRDIGLEKRLTLLMDGSSPFNQFYQEFWRGIFKYVSQVIEKMECKIPDADLVFKEVLGWELGLFEIWNCLDARNMVKRMEIQGYEPEPWVYKMLSNGENSFFQIRDGQQLYYDLSGEYLPAYGADKMILPHSFINKVVWENGSVAIYEFGDDILNTEIHTYRNIIDEDVANGILHAIDLSEKRKNGLIISAKGKDFTVGANLGLVFFAAIEKNYKTIDHLVSGFQQLTSRIRYSEVPIVMVPKGLTLGGGYEMALHCDAIICHTETYMGLPEARAGLVPAGGGTKEMAIRLLKGSASPDKYVEILLNLSEGKVSASAFEALEWNYLDNEKQIIRNKNWQLAAAKKLLVEALDTGYAMPEAITLTTMGLPIRQHLENTIQQKVEEWSPFQIKLANHIAFILSGGNTPAGSVLAEQYYLDLEREAFLSLCGERDTLKRLKDILR